MLVFVACLAMVLGGVRWLLVGEPPGLWLIVMAAHGGDDTIYATGFSERRFDAIRVGMTSREVEQALGPPLRKGESYWPGGDEVWEYSMPPHGSSFYRRWAYIKDGRVSLVLDDYYFD